MLMASIKEGIEKQELKEEIDIISLASFPCLFNGGRYYGKSCI